MNDPGIADAAAKAVAAQQAMQSVSDKRNELESSLSSLLEHSVLQNFRNFMKFSRNFVKFRQIFMKIRSKNDEIHSKLQDCHEFCEIFENLQETFHKIC